MLDIKNFNNYINRVKIKSSNNTIIELTHLFVYFSPILHLKTKYKTLFKGYLR